MKKSWIERFQIVANNAKGDANAPVYLGGLFKGYLAFDNSQSSHYRWLCVISCAVLYNLIFVIGRTVFWELENMFPIGWYVMDYSSDVIYLLDMFIRMHEGNFSVLVTSYPFSHWDKNPQFIQKFTFLSLIFD